MMIQDREALRDEVRAAMRKTEALDLWSALPLDPFASEKWHGVDALLAENPRLLREAKALRVALPDSQAERAEAIFQALFVERRPVGDAEGRVLLTLDRLAGPLAERDLNALRERCADIPPEEALARVMELAKLRGIVCTLNPFADDAIWIWEKLASGGLAKQLLPVLSVEAMQRAVERDLPLGDIDGTIMPGMRGAHIERMFSALERWALQTDICMVRASWPEIGMEHDLLMRCVILPFCEERRLPLMMALSERPEEADAQWRWARDALSRERALRLVLVARDRHGAELLLSGDDAVTPGRVFPVLTHAGAPADAVARAGMRAMPFASGSNVLEQSIGDWAYARRDISQALYDGYLSLINLGWGVSREEIEADAARLLGGNWEEFCGLAKPAQAPDIEQTEE